MNAKETAARIYVMETLLEMVIRDMPDAQQSDLMDRLSDRMANEETWSEIARQWERRVLRERAPSHDPATSGLDSILMNQRRNAQIFGPDE